MSPIGSGHYGEGVARRTKRLWTDEEKLSICFQTAAPGVSLAQVALRYAVNANLIFKWRRDPRYAPDPASAPGLLEGSRFLPVEIVETVKPPPASPQRALGRGRFRWPMSSSRGASREAPAI